MYELGIIGLGTMGLNLALNLNDHGYKVIGYDLDQGKVDVASGQGIPSTNIMKEFVSALSCPRKILVLVPSIYVDDVLESLSDYLSESDIIIDGGNSYWKDTERRVIWASNRGFHFIGMGISGGAKGARYGPSLMPGGDRAAWPYVSEMFRTIAAKFEGSPCCEWMGSGGAGHFVKMVHNGIEYAEMELIAEAYHLLRSTRTNDEIAAILNKWNAGKLGSYLLEITEKILLHKRSDGSYIIDDILDQAGQKGTGKWTVINAMDYGTPLNLISSAVHQRFISSRKKLRLTLSQTFQKEGRFPSLDPVKIENALLFGRILAYTEGFYLIYTAGKENGWDLDLSSIARVWRAGCIIRSKLLADIISALSSGHSFLILDKGISEMLKSTFPALKDVVVQSMSSNIPLPAFSNALMEFESIISDWLPANIIQAQRDYFGSHGFHMVGDPNTKIHWNWDD